MVLAAGIPVGGYIVVKVGGMAVKRAAFLLRRARTVDDVVEQGRTLGFELRYAADAEALGAIAGDAVAEAMERRPVHVGAGAGQRVGKENPWNPSNRHDNCTACVAAVMRNSLEGYFKYSADDMERFFGDVGAARQLDPHSSLRYIERATGLKASRRPVSMIGDGTRVGAPGHYAVFTNWYEGRYHHVVYGHVTSAGRVIIFDPQSMGRMGYQQMLKRYGKALPYLLE